MRQLDRADDLVAVLEADHVPLVLVGEHLGVDPLDHAVRGCRAPARARRCAASSAPAARSPGREGHQLADRAPPDQVRVVGGGRQLGQVEDAEPEQPPGAGEQRRPRRGRWPARRRRPRRAGTRPPPEPGGSSEEVRASSPVEDRRRSRGRRRPRAGTAAVAAAPADSSSTVRRGVPKVLATSASSSETTFRSRASSPRIASSSSIVALAARTSPSPARAGRTSSAGAAACRGCSRPGPRSGRRPSISRSWAAAALSEDADQLDHLVDVEDRDQQAVDQVQPVGGLAAAERRAAADDLEAVLEEDLAAAP